MPAGVVAESGASIYAPAVSGSRVGTLIPLMLALVACGEEQSDPAEGASAGAQAGSGETAEPEEPDVPPLEEPPPGDALAQEMYQRATQFAEGMGPATPLFRGTLQNGATQDYQAVLQGSRCFKIIGVGAEGVSDLDLFLFDPDGVQVQQDTATDSYPVLGLAHPICPDRAGAYRVQVKMFEGSGDFGVQVFQSAMQ